MYFKRITILILIISICAGFPGIVQAQFAGYNESFDSYATGSQPTIANWTMSDGNVVIADVPSATDKSLKLEKTATSSNPSVSLSFAAMTGTVILHTKIFVSDTATKEKAFYLKGATGETSEPVRQIPFLFISKDKLSIFNGNGWMDVPKTPYQFGTWLNLSVVIDTVNKKFTIYFNGNNTGTYTLKQVDGWDGGGKPIAWDQGIVGLGLDAGDNSESYCLLNDFILEPLETLGEMQVKSASPANGSVDIPLNSNVEVEFNHDIDISSIKSEIYITKNGGAVPDSEYTIVNGDASGGTKKCIIDFNSPLDSAASYVVTVGAGVKDIYGQNLKSSYIIAFNTLDSSFGLQGEPVITVQDSQGQIVDAWSPNGSVTVDLDIRNTTNDAKSGVLIIGLHDEEGTLRDITYQSKDIASGITQHYTVGLSLPASINPNYKLGIYIWNSLYGMMPIAEKYLYPYASYYVSSTGSDSGTGTITQPFKTLQRAKEAIRGLKSTTGLPAGGVTVYLREGDYRISSTFLLEQQDSGDDSSKITYCAYGNEKVRILGGKSLKWDDFTQITDAEILARLPHESKNNVFQYNLKSHGISDYGTIQAQSMYSKSDVQSGELFFNGQPMTLGRYPNEGYVNTGFVFNQSSLFAYAGDRPLRWTNAKDIWIAGLLQYDWLYENVGVASIDTINKQIQTAQAPVMGIESNRPYYYYNLLEEIDSPGEWYIDRNSGILYFYPPTDVASGEIVFSTLKDDIVRLENTSDITFKNIIFEYGRKNGIVIDRGSDNTVANCVIQSVGAVGSKVSGTNSGIENSTICYTGLASVELTGGKFDTLTPSSNFVENNRIHDYNRTIKTLNGGVSIYGVGMKVAHNLIYDGPHIAIICQGNDNIIEYNEIYNVCTDTQDSGAIYMGQSWTRRGNVIRYNYIHDIGQNASGDGVSGIYLDDQLSGTTVYGNVLYNLFRPILMGGGCDNTIENNIMIDCQRSVLMDNRGETWQVPTLAAGQLFYDDLMSMPYTQEPWKSKYPTLVNILTDNPGSPKRNILTKNVALSCGALAISNSVRAYGAIQDPWIPPTSNIGFVDKAGKNFTLKNDSIVFSQFSDFTPIPFESIGLEGN